MADRAPDGDVQALDTRIAQLERSRRHDRAAARAFADAFRDALRLYERAVSPGGIKLGARDLKKLRKLASRAFFELGGEPDSPMRSLRDYDDARFGPYLGVSGESTAAPAIREAALASAKVEALGLTDPLEIGVAHDAERLGSIGELPVGPDEYRDIRIECLGRILTSTNVGARVNVRIYGRVRLVWVNAGPPKEIAETAVESVRERLGPFLNTPDGTPRRAKIHVQFRNNVPTAHRRAVLAKLVAAMNDRTIASKRHHQLALAANVRNGRNGVADAREAFGLAGASGLQEVALTGKVRSAADVRVSLPGLLNYFNPSQVRQILEEAASRKIAVTTLNVVDTESVARQSWSALEAARRMGLALGKYGLFPLTLEEAERVAELIQGWFPGWSAAPVFYVDVPMISRDRVYRLSEVGHAARAWLRAVARAGAQVVLIDTVEKGQNRRLMKHDAHDSRGILTADEIARIDRYARARGVRALWAGGLSARQAYELGQRAVFGVYVTSAVASLQPVGPAHEEDPALAAERLPTREGVAHVKLLLEAGFLTTRLSELGEVAHAREIDHYAGRRVTDGSADQSHDAELRRAVIAGWRKLADDDTWRRS